MSLITNYTIDNGEPVMRTQPALPGKTASNHSVLFLSPTLDLGPHNLTIDVLRTGTNRRFTLTSYFVFSNNSGSNSLEENHDNGHGDNNHTHMSVGAIVGSVLGALVLVLFITLGIIYISRRRRRSQTKRFEAKRFGPMKEYPEESHFVRECICLIA